MDKKKALNNLKITSIVILFFVIATILILGLTSFFSFIPKDWGSYDEDGEFTPYRTLIPSYAAIVIAGYSVYSYIRYKDEKRKSLNKDIVLTMLNRYNELTNLAKNRGIVEIYKNNLALKKQALPIVMDDSSIKVKEVLEEAKENTGLYLCKKGFLNDEIKEIIGY